jgi:hypothetical protein
MKQCKDIPTIPLLEFIAQHGGIGCNWFDIDFDNPRSVRRAMPSGSSNNLVRAKMRKLIASGLIDGCTCGCRGDYEITEKGRAFLQDVAGSQENP